MKRFMKTCCVLLALIMSATVGTVFPFLTASAESEDNIQYFGTVVPCEKDNGYIPKKIKDYKWWDYLTIPQVVTSLVSKDDPHSGWSLGSFYVKGFSGSTVSDQNSFSQKVPVYLKNVGDVLEFGFKLEQNIDALNGNPKLTIADDHKIVQDCWVDDPYIKTDFHRGVLLVVHTDYQGQSTLVSYIDFLSGCSVGANTKVKLFEEGDYRVILCYEIYKKSKASWIVDWANPDGSWFDYRIESYFSVRNGNCMVYPIETGTEYELTNQHYTEKGFRVDLAKSRYLKLTVKKELLNRDGTDIIADTRFNKVVADGTVFTDEGKYTITVKNPYTDAVTEKIIYVGTDPIMKCNAVTNKSIPEINQLLSNGYSIAQDGNLVLTSELNQYEHNNNLPSRNSVPGNNGENNQGIWIFMSVVAIGMFALIITLLLRKKKV